LVNKIDSREELEKEKDEEEKVSYNMEI